MSRPSVSWKTRNDILHRYGDCCVKCGRRKYLEIHHITLMMNNGKDNYFNLVPLCRECHRFAPDDYIEFLKYLGSRYNPHFDAMRQIGFAFTKYFHEISKEEYNEFKQTSVEEYFKHKLEPMFIGIRKMIYGFDDDELQLDLLSGSEREEIFNHR